MQITQFYKKQELSMKLIPILVQQRRSLAIDMIAKEDLFIEAPIRTICNINDNTILQVLDFLSTHKLACGAGDIFKLWQMKHKKKKSSLISQCFFFCRILLVTQKVRC